MSPWTAVRVAGPVSVGLGFVLLRPTWVSVAVLGLLLCVAVWLDGQERRADDVEDMADDFRAELCRLGERLTDERKAQIDALGQSMNKVADVLGSKIREVEARLDAMAQQRKGPML